MKLPSRQVTVTLSIAALVIVFGGLISMFFRERTDSKSGVAWHACSCTYVMSRSKTFCANWLGVSESSLKVDPASHTASYKGVSSRWISPRFGCEAPAGAKRL